jgi:hypothetical protein
MRTQLALKAALALGAFCAQCAAQTYQRLGGCPSLGCILPPDQVDFLPGQFFDIRVETHAPINGSEVVPGYTIPDSNFTLTIAKDGQTAQSAASFFKIQEPMLETWNFTWYEDLFAKAAHTPSLVKVAAKIYRRVALYEPGNYIATLNYRNGSQTYANWTVRDVAPKRKAKNIVMFIGDGMTTNMITGKAQPREAVTFKANVMCSRSIDCSPTDQRQIPDEDGHGLVPCPGPPNDPFFGLVHHRQCELGHGTLHRAQIHRQCLGLLCRQLQVTLR